MAYRSWQLLSCRPLLAATLLWFWFSGFHMEENQGKAKLGGEDFIRISMLGPLTFQRNPVL